MNQEKKLKHIIKLSIEAGRAAGGPPLSSILGNYKVNTNEFCKDFNQKTSLFKEGVPLSVIIYVYDNKSYDYLIKTPAVSFFLKKLSDVDSCSSGSDYCSYITFEQLYELLNLKKKEFLYLKDYSLLNTLISNANSMGILLK